MEYCNIPDCALNRTAGTVIVRVNMEVQDRCCRPEAFPASKSQMAVHRPSDCELCSRTRLNSQYSDCDSGLVDKSRPYRSSAARSRYVNVCAAVCLLLLVGGLSPRSSAAPHRSRGNMERTRRATDTNENHLWGNPCDYNKSDVRTSSDVPMSRLREVASQAKTAFDATANYSNTFASKLHSYDRFDELLTLWSSTEWLRKFSWFREEVLPKEKELNHTMPDEYMNKLMNNIDEVLPVMYKGLKMVVAGLYSMTKHGLDDTDSGLKNNLTQSMHEVRAVLCLFNDIMASRNLEMKPLPDSEIPDFQNSPDKLALGVVVYRDTLNYLEYLSQVFQKIYDKESA